MAGEEGDRRPRCRRPTAAIRALAALALFLVGLPACSPRPAAHRPSFIFVLVDTLRRDHLSVYGDPRETTPFLEERAARGLVFEHAVAQAPWTTASMASLWTSRYPSEAGIQVYEDALGFRFIGRSFWKLDGGTTARTSSLAQNAVTLASVLGEHGYWTSSIVANANAGHAFGLLKGFAENDEKARPAPALVDRAIEYIDAYVAQRGDAPLFLYLHFIDPHQPTDPPPPYDTLFPTIDGKPNDPSEFNWEFTEGVNLEGPAFESFRSHKLALYDGEVRLVDDQLRRLAQHLAARGLDDRFVWVVMADHGEEFWDHAAFEKRNHEDPRNSYGVGHGHTLFGELLDVPLILWGPGVPTARVDAQVRSLDVAPTVVGLAGIAPVPSFRGIDLLAALRRHALRPLPAFAEGIAYGHEAKSLEADGYKYIVHSPTKPGQKEFLFARPGGALEGEDVSARDPERLASMRSLLNHLVTDLDIRPPRWIKVDESTRRNLKALGYLE